MRGGVGRIKRFYHLSWRERRLFVESLVLQIWIGLLIKIIPFRWIPRVFSSPQSSVSSLQSSVFSRQSEIIEMIGAATSRAAGVSPWRNRCLVSSLAARCMLRRRKIHSQLSLGVAKEDGGNVIAHAWLTAGEAEIVAKGDNFQQLYLF